MARLIDADAFITQYCEDCGYGCDQLFCATVRDLKNAPTVDAVEVERGWWIELPGMEPDYKCSECGRSYAWWEPSEAHYCPNCGAKMDGDGNG